MSSSTAFTVLWFNSLVLSLPVALLILYVKPNSRYFLLALYLGILLAITDRATNEVQLPAFFLLTFGAWLGFSRPRQSWLWGILLGSFIPLLTLLLILMGRATVSGESLSSLLALIPPTIASYAGAFIRRRSDSRQAILQKPMEEK